MKKGVLIFWAVIIVLIIAGIALALTAKAAPGKYDQLAQCIKDRGVIFYGAFWCPHCQKTKALFGNSAKLLPYVECSTPDGKGQLQICIDKKITNYPTWIRPDGAVITGEHSISELATFSGCTVDGQQGDFGTVNGMGTSSKVQ